MTGTYVQMDLFPLPIWANGPLLCDTTHHTHDCTGFNVTNPFQPDLASVTCPRNLPGNWTALTPHSDRPHRPKMNATPHINSGKPSAQTLSGRIPTGCVSIHGQQKTVVPNHACKPTDSPALTETEFAGYGSLAFRVAAR